MEAIIRDIQYGVRSLLRDKGFAATVVLTLAICIGANTATFAIVNSVLLRPLPVPDANSIVLISNRYPKAGVGDLNQSSAGDYYDRIREVTALGQQALFRMSDQTIEINGVPEQIKGMAVTPSLFPLLGISPSNGRAFTAPEGEIGSEQKIILSAALSRQVYGGNSAIGRELRLGGRPFTVIGVMPRDFLFVKPEALFWIPLALTAEEKNGHHNNNWYHIGRLKPGASVTQVQSQIDALNTANLDRFPQFKEILINAGFHTSVEPLQHLLVKDVEGALYLLWGGAVFVLLIGALNIANLALSRMIVRRKEIATRLAIGASRAHLTRQLVVENLLLAGSGGIAGVALGSALLRTLGGIGLGRLPRAQEVSVDSTVILVALAMAVATGLVIALLPLADVFNLNLNHTFRQDSRTGTSATRTRRIHQGLVAAQIGFAFVLLAGAGLLLSSFRYLLRVDPGFVSAGVLTASTSAPRSRYPGDGELRALMSRALDSIRRLPGVTAAGATNGIPFSGNSNDSVIFAEGYVMKPGESVLSPLQLRVTPGYFDAMGITLTRGRDFQDRDNETSPLAIIVDERLARRFWPDRDPIGQRMYQPDDTDHPTTTTAKTRWLHVVGVVRSVRLADLSGRGNPVGADYFPYAQTPSRGYTIAMKTTTDMGALARAVRSELSRIDPQLALFDIRSMAERTELSMAPRRTSMLLAMAFGGLALFLSGIGIYGVLAYLVTQRRREIAIRVALGSTRAGIVNLVLREGVILAGIGVAAGLGGAATLQKAVANEIYGVQPLDPLVMGSVSALLALIALMACALPARRAVLVDPVAALNE